MTALSATLAGECKKGRKVKTSERAYEREAVEVSSGARRRAREGAALFDIVEKVEEDTKLNSEQGKLSCSSVTEKVA
jgi:hypothetical protein